MAPRAPAEAAVSRRALHDARSGLDMRGALALDGPHRPDAQTPHLPPGGRGARLAGGAAHADAGGVPARARGLAPHRDAWQRGSRARRALRRDATRVGLALVGTR